MLGVYHMFSATSGLSCFYNHTWLKNIIWSDLKIMCVCWKIFIFDGRWLNAWKCLTVLAGFFTNGNISVSKHCKPQHVLHGNNNYISIQPIFLYNHWSTRLKIMFYVQGAGLALCFHLIKFFIINPTKKWYSISFCEKGETLFLLRPD